MICAGSRKPSTSIGSAPQDAVLAQEAEEREEGQAEDGAVLAAAARSLVDTARARRLDTLTVEQVSGAFVYGTPAGRALLAAGFVESSRGLTLRRAR